MKTKNNTIYHTGDIRYHTPELTPHIVHGAPGYITRVMTYDLVTQKQAFTLVPKLRYEDYQHRGGAGS